MQELSKNWRKIKGRHNEILDNGEGKVFLSYNPNDFIREKLPSNLDSANPETAIVLMDDKLVNGEKQNRYLICRGDHRAKLEEIYPDIEKLKEYWKLYGGHFWSDDLDNYPAETNK